MAPRRQKNNFCEEPSINNEGLCGNPPRNACNFEPILGSDAQLLRCCVPTGDCLRAPETVIQKEKLNECVKVQCNNENCFVGKYMHRECFDAWEKTILTYVKSCGRARSWSERQRQQNIWTKKGYDLAYKVCSCLCQKGHLKKDLNWKPSIGNFEFEGARDCDINAQSSNKRKKKRARHNTRPALVVNAKHTNNGSNYRADNQVFETQRTTSTGSSSRSLSASTEPSVSSVHSDSLSKKPKTGSSNVRSRSCYGIQSIFGRRMDFNGFNILPNHKFNTYRIKVENDADLIDEEMCYFVLSTLKNHKMSKIPCVVCEKSLVVFDRYPLLDGTFFFSPKKHNESCLKIKTKDQVKYLAALCLGCIEGRSSGRILHCKFCGEIWNGSTLVLGSVYSYDIFAAMLCCSDRSKCIKCHKPLLLRYQHLNFYSDYSQKLACFHCQTVDSHFVKPISSCYIIKLQKTTSIN